MPYLKLLGGAVVEDEAGGVADLASRRLPLAVLALLSTASTRTLNRGRVAGLLWPETPEATARNRLSTYVHQVRKELGPEVLVSVGDDLRLDVDALPCDVCRFEDALEAGEPAAAVELYAGPFLDGFRIRESAAFGKWRDRERQRLRRRYRRALETLAREAAGRGEPEGAARWWRERVEEDPYDSRATARLMEALAAAGNPAAALRRARTHARLLREEFGAEPSEEVRSLAARIREAGSVAPAGDRPAGGAASTVAPGLEPRVVAVLPFEDLGGGEDAVPFAAGLHSDLLTELSRVAGLTVIARASLLGHHGGTTSLRAVARELGAGTVVRGGVRRMGGRVRLNVQLVDARDGSLGWAERYDRELTAGNLFDLQSELARKVAATLEAELAPRREAEAARPTENLAAYRLYAQGRWLLDQRTRDKVRRSVGYFRRATDRDPDYALAWAGLADALSLLEFYAYPVPEGTTEPMVAARRALELDPRLGEAHASVGICHSLRQEGPAALRRLGQALELSPGYAEAQVWLAWVQLLVGRPEAALGPSRRGVELNPLAPAFRAYRAETLLADGQREQALREARRAREIRPAYGLAHYLEGIVLHHLGRPEEASAALEASLSRTPRDGTPCHEEVHAALAATAAGAGDRSTAREALAHLEGGDHPFSTGLARAALGETDAAFDAFRAVETWNSFSTEHLRYFFPEILGPLREDPRYGRLLEHVNRSWGMGAGDPARADPGGGLT